MRWTVWGLLWAVACATPEPEDYHVGDVDDPGDDLEDSDDPIEETWGLVQVYSSLIRNPNPLSSEEGVTSTTSTKLLEWTREGTSVTWNETLCALESTPVFGTHTSYPEAFVAYMPVYTRQAELSDTVTGATLEAGPFLDLLGVELEQPADDALPTEADDPRVFDMDQDGFPGVTVHVEQDLLGAGDVYVLQRTSTELIGTVLSDDRIEGHVEIEPEQVVLGATSWWLELDTDQRPDPDPEHNFFALQRLEPGATCADVEGVL